MDCDYAKYDFAEDNFYYDISIFSSRRWELEHYGDEIEYNKDNVDNFRKEKIESAYDRIEECRKIAKENPDKFYVLCIEHVIKIEDNCYLLFDYDSESFGHYDISQKQDIIDRLISCYRDPVVDVYASIGYDKEMTNKYNDFAYDIRDLKEITDVGKIFKDGVNYTQIIEDKVKAHIVEWSGLNVSEEEINEYLKDVEYRIREDEIFCVIPRITDKNANYLGISFSNIDTLLNIYETK